MIRDTLKTTAPAVRDALHARDFALAWRIIVVTVKLIYTAWRFDYAHDRSVIREFLSRQRYNTFLALIRARYWCKAAMVRIRYRFKLFILRLKGI